MKPATATEHRGGASPYKLGRALEYRIMTNLGACGWFCMRSTGSKGPVDVIAIARERPTLLIQAKRLGSVSSLEWNALYRLAEAHGAWAILCMRVSERKIGFYRIVGLREYRSRRKPYVAIDPETAHELTPPLLAA